MSNICTANLLGMVLGPNEVLCLKILRKKWKGLQLLHFLLVQLVPVHAHFCIFMKTKQNTAFYRLKRETGWQGTERSHQLWEADDLASSPALSFSEPACILSFCRGQFPAHTEKPVAVLGNNRPQCSPLLLILSFPPADSCRGLSSKFYATLLN